MDRLFDDFFAPAAGEGRSFAQPPQQGAASFVSPSIDVDESEQAYVVTAELPGIAEQDIELNLRDNALTISGEKRSERNEEEGGRRYCERSFGRFQRTIPFPNEVDAYNRLGKALTELGRYADARDAYGRAVKLDSISPSPRARSEATLF